jgi:hypothetical protein
MRAPQEADELLVALEHAGKTVGTISTDSDILVRGGTLLLWTPRAHDVFQVSAATCAQRLGVQPKQVSVRNLFLVLRSHAHAHRSYYSSSTSHFSQEATTATARTTSGWCVPCSTCASTTQRRW